jgi:hypothetical protein
MKIEFNRSLVEGAPPKDAAAWIIRTTGCPRWSDIYSNIPTLEALFPSLSEDELVAAAHEASALLSSALEAAKSKLGANYLRNKHPSFLESTYQMVHSYGRFLER